MWQNSQRNIFNSNHRSALIFLTLQHVRVLRRDAGPSAPGLMVRAAVRGAFTLAIIPDIQYHTDLRHRLYRLYPWSERSRPNLTHFFLEKMRWIAARHEQLNLLAAIFMGDLTQADAEEEWEAVRQGLALLPPGLAYCLTQGDLDLGYERTAVPPFYFQKAAHRGSHMGLLAAQAAA